MNDGPCGRDSPTWQHLRRHNECCVLQTVVLEHVLSLLEEAQCLSFST
jgi:hypothetical protein